MNLNYLPPAENNRSENNGLRSNGSATTSAPRTPPSAVPVRRYPSLCDDDQPLFPLWGNKSQTTDASDGASSVNERCFVVIRAIAVLMIVGFLAFLAAGR